MVTYQDRFVAGATALAIGVFGGFIAWGPSLDEPRPVQGPQWEPIVQRVELITTGYHCPAGRQSKQCDRKVDDGRTASNTPVKRGVCAADWNYYPVGTWFLIPHYGPCRVEDRGSRIRGRRVDLYFEDGPTAVQWGVRKVNAIMFPESFTRE